jgi:hypothetical protein
MRRNGARKMTGLFEFDGREFITVNIEEPNQRWAEQKGFDAPVFVVKLFFDSVRNLFPVVTVNVDALDQQHLWIISTLAKPGAKATLLTPLEFLPRQKHPSQPGITPLLRGAHDRFQ